MALQTPVVTKVSVVETQERLYMVTLHLSVVDTDGGGIEQDFTVKYKYGTAIAPVESYMKEQMQIAIDRYKHAKTVFNSAQLATAMTNIKNGLVV